MNISNVALKQLVCGIVAGGIASAATAPLAVVKTKLIASKGSKTALEVVSNMIKTQGLYALMPSGWFTSICVTSVKRGVQFVAFEAVTKNLGENPKLLPLPEGIPVPTVAGAVSGLASWIVTYPLDTVQDRLILQPKKYPSLSGALKRVLSEEGIGGLYNGALPAVYKNAVEFYAYETLKSKYLFSDKKKKPQIGVAATLLIGACAGAFSTAVAYPLELVRKELSLSAVPKSGFSEYRHTWQALSTTIRKHGIGGLYRGLHLELVHIVPSIAISFLVYELMKRALEAETRS